MDQPSHSLALNVKATTPAVAQDRVTAMEALGGYVRRVFDRNADHKRSSGIETRLLKCLRMSRCIYSSEELMAFKAVGAPPIYSGIADSKRRAAMAILGEIFSNPGDKPFTLAPTPKPDVPDHVVAEATVETMKDWLEYVILTNGDFPPPEAVAAYAEKKRDEITEREIEWAKRCAVRMERKVHDQMVEGGWTSAFSEYSDYVCTYGTAIMKGPVPRVRRRKEVVRSKAGTSKYVMRDKIVVEYEAVSPWDIFPSPGAKKIIDGDLCQRVRFTPADLRRFAGSKSAKGWRCGVVNSILELHPSGGIHETLPNDYERRLLESDGIESSDDCGIEGIEFWGEVRGSVLIELDITKTATNAEIEPEEYYESNVVTVLGRVVFCRIIDQEIGRPMSKGVFYEAPGSWWGDSLMEKMEATLKVANASLRDLVVNMAQASGPQTVIKDLGRLDPSCTLEQRPWKVWVFNAGPMGQSENPIHVFQPNSNASDLLRVHDWAIKQTDIDTGMPAYTYGSNIAAGAARTASGLAMLTEAASRGSKKVVNVTDQDVIRDTVKRTSDFNMLYDADESIKGDFEVNPSGIIGLILREQESARRRAFLQLTANPIDMQIIGVEGRAVVLREEAKSLSVNPDDVVPSKDKLMEIAALNQAKEQLQLEQQQALTEQTRQDGAPQAQPGEAQSAVSRQAPHAAAQRMPSIGVREQQEQGAA